MKRYAGRLVERKGEYIDWLKTVVAPSYGTMLKKAIELSRDKDNYEEIDPERITLIDYGEYQGTKLFVISNNDYQPSRFWFVKVAYGSCSACDSLQAAWDYGNNKNYEALYNLALQMLQGLKEMR